MKCLQSGINDIEYISCRTYLQLQPHQLAKFPHFAAADRHLKIQVAQFENIGVVEPGLDLADLAQVDAVRTVTPEK